MRYKHYKTGDVYDTLVATPSSNSPTTLMTIYRRERDGMLFYRPIVEFDGLVEHRGEMVRRFEQITDTAVTSDLTQILDPRAREHEAWPYFVHSMQGRVYGAPALNDAWAWFRTGWSKTT